MVDGNSTSWLRCILGVLMWRLRVCYGQLEFRYIYICMYVVFVVYSRILFAWRPWYKRQHLLLEKNGVDNLFVKVLKYSV